MWTGEGEESFLFYLMFLDVQCDVELLNHCLDVAVSAHGIESCRWQFCYIKSTLYSSLGLLERLCSTLIRSLHIVLSIIDHQLEIVPHYHGNRRGLRNSTSVRIEQTDAIDSAVFGFEKLNKIGNCVRDGLKCK